MSSAADSSSWAWPRASCSASSSSSPVRWLPELFSTDPAVVALAGFLLLFVAAMQPINGAVFVLDGLLIGAGDMAFLGRAMWIALAVFAPLALGVAALGLGIGWLWGALIVFMLARLAVLARRWRTDSWAVTGAVR